MASDNYYNRSTDKYLIETAELLNVNCENGDFTWKPSILYYDIDKNFHTSTFFINGEYKTVDEEKQKQYYDNLISDQSGTSCKNSLGLSGTNRCDLCRSCVKILRERFDKPKGQLIKEHAMLKNKVDELSTKLDKIQERLAIMTSKPTF